MKDKTIKVLLVEDNLGDARLVSESLADISKPTFRVTHVETLNEGLRQIERNKFDVLLLDLLLDDTPRLGTLMEIYGHADKLPIIVLTGLEDPTVGLWVLNEGAQDYLVKGKIDSNTLSHSILYAIEKYDEQARQLSTAHAQ